MIKNAIVLMFDSLQFNYLGCYGNEWIKTPNMDRLAREGALFENCYIEGLPTVPCRRAMHTGRYTLPFSGWVPLSMEDTTIADLCWGRPIDTALIFDCPNYRLPKFGYSRGFDKVWFTHGHEGDEVYFNIVPLIHHNVDDYFDEKTMAGMIKQYGEQVTNVNRTEAEHFLKVREASGTDRHVTKTITKAMEYLEGVDRNKQFYLWIDSFDPHEPWDPPSMHNPDMKCPYDPDYDGKDEFTPFPVLVDGIYTERQLHHIRMMYAEIVTVCDEWLGKLMDCVRRLGLEENTLFWMVSDHGEPLGNAEHGHGIMRKCRPWPYEELVHAPSLIRVPGAKPGQRIKGFIQSVDVAPTVCDWLGIGVHPDMQGKSLLPLVFGEVDKVRDFAIAGYHPYSWSIITEDWSYIHWNTSPNAFKAMEMSNFYTDGIDYDHLGTSEGDLRTAYREDKGELKGVGKNNTLDGADQWSCTPSASTQVPEEDELYDRHTDPFQLKNVIKDNPEVAKRLLATLREHMAMLKAS